MGYFLKKIKLFFITPGFVYFNSTLDCLVGFYYKLHLKTDQTDSFTHFTQALAFSLNTHVASSSYIPMYERLKK